MHKLIGHKPEEAVLFLTADVVCDRLVQTCQNIDSPEQHPESVFPEIADNTGLIIVIDNIFALRNKIFTQKRLALILNTLMEEQNISIVIAGIDLPNRVPVLWEGLTGKSHDDISSVEL